MKGKEKDNRKNYEIGQGRSLTFWGFNCHLWSWSRSEVLNLGFQYPLRDLLMGLIVPTNPLTSWTKCLFSHIHIFLDLAFIALMRFSKKRS